MREFRGDWRDLFHTFRMALDPRKLSLALAALWMAALGLLLILCVFTFAADQAAVRAGDLPPDQTFTAHLFDGHWSLMADRAGAFLRAHLGNDCLARCAAGSEMARRLARIVDVLLPVGTVAAAVGLLCPKTAVGVGCLAIAAIWTWFIAAGLGGAIARIAAVEIAKDERMEIAEALRYAGSNYKAFFWAPLSVVIGIVFFVICNVGAGLLLRGVYFAFDNRVLDPESPLLDGLAHAASWTLLVIGFPLALLSGFLIVLLALGLVGGWPLMIPAMAAEGTDAFDAVSRSFSYVFARPWRYLAQHAVLLLYAVPSVLFVLGFACAFSHLAVATGEVGMGEAFAGPGAALRATLGTLGIGPGAELPPDATARGFGWALSAIVLLVFGFAVAYAPAFLLTGWTTIYFLLRRSVDGTGMGEVWEEEEEMDEAAPPPSPPAP